MKPYAKDKNPKGWKTLSKPHPNRRNKIRVDKKSARQKAKREISKIRSAP
jgi:hypothetical protein